MPQLLLFTCVSSYCFYSVERNTKLCEDSARLWITYKRCAEIIAIRNLPTEESGSCTWVGFFISPSKVRPMKLLFHRPRLHWTVTWGHSEGSPSPTPHSHDGLKQKPKARWDLGKHQRYFVAPRLWAFVAQDISRADVISLFSNLEYISIQVLVLSSVCINFKYSSCFWQETPQVCYMLEE